MKTWIERIIIKNRAPFENLDVAFNENEIAVLSAVNGSGKTTLLSYIVDAWHEMTRPHYSNEYKGKENSFYRVSANIYSLNPMLPSFVYIRFQTTEGHIDYVDIRGNLSQEQYNDYVKIENKIEFNSFAKNLEDSFFVKKMSDNNDKKKANKIFNNNIITYFPAYRYEVPGYLNDPYEIELDFCKKSGFSGFLNNPIEVISGLPQLANWILDVVLDTQLYGNPTLTNNLNHILSQILISKKKGSLRLGIGSRNYGAARIQVTKKDSDETIYPTIFNLSSGESAMLCLFGELLKQADSYRNDILLSEITGIVLIDEVDKHLHIKLQKEVLPQLFQIFPNVQFILSSHSPFLNIGLAETARERTKIINLDNFGISADPTTNELYTEVYNMMINENERFKNEFVLLREEIEKATIPLLITEGKTDATHIKKAKEKLNIVGCDVDFYQITEDWGDSKLKSLLEHLSKVKQNRKIIGIFDRDVSSILNDIEKDGREYKDYGNNVFAFCIPIPIGREVYTNISIEFYYSDVELNDPALKVQGFKKEKNEIL